jgi:hypothetical protein
MYVAYTNATMPALREAQHALPYRTRRPGKGAPMERQGPSPAVPAKDCFPPELRRLCGTAVAVLHEHAKSAALCAACRSWVAVGEARVTRWALGSTVGLVGWLVVVCGGPSRTR